MVDEVLVLVERRWGGGGGGRSRQRLDAVAVFPVDGEDWMLILVVWGWWGQVRSTYVYRYGEMKNNKPNNARTFARVEAVEAVLRQPPGHHLERGEPARVGRLPRTNAGAVYGICIYVNDPVRRC